MSYFYILYIARTTSHVRCTIRCRMLHVRHRTSCTYDIVYTYDIVGGKNPDDGQHDIEWGSPTALHVTTMNVKPRRRTDIEHSPAMIEVMNRNNLKYAFGHGPLSRKIEENISPITVASERVRPTTDISRQERKRQIMQMARSVCVFNDGDVRWCNERLGGVLCVFN
jgi:hypothetical protein